MIGRFQRIGDTIFPGAEPEIRCGVFEWRGTITDEIGELSIRFFSPDGTTGLRQYFVAPVLNAWVKKDKEKREDSDAFLARACEVGYEIVAALNNHRPEQRQAYRLAAWLFRNRNVGHIAVAREFNDAADFVDLSNPSNPVLLLPGLGVNQTERRWAGTEARGTARQQLGEAIGQLREQMAERGEELPQIPLNFPGMLELYDRLLGRDEPQISHRTALVCIDGQEDKFILPLLSSVNPLIDFGRIESTVADCLIYGPTEFSGNFDVLATHPEQWEYLGRQLTQKLLEPGTAPTKLDAWLTRIKSDGYLQLIEGGRRLAEEAREEASELASQMVCAMTWCAYRMMGYCYGALMEVVAEDLEQSEPRPSPLDGLVFRCEHCQIDLLAGLPLDFLGRAQLRWIIDVWRDALVTIAGNFFAPGRHDASAALLRATTRFELFAYLLRQRRDADRLTKRAPVEHLDQLIPRTPPDEFDGDYIRRNDVGPEIDPVEIEDAKTEGPDAVVARADVSEATHLTTEFCPNCGSKIQLNASIDLVDTTQAQFWGFCPRCDTLKVYVANLDELMRRRQRTR